MASATDTPNGPARRGETLPMRFGLSSGTPGATKLVVFFLTYMLAAAFGRWMIVIPDMPITVWPPNGVVLAMLLTQPRRSWGWWLGLGAWAS